MRLFFKCPGNRAFLLAVLPQITCFHFSGDAKSAIAINPQMLHNVKTLIIVDINDRFAVKDGPGNIRLELRDNKTSKRILSSQINFILEQLKLIAMEGYQNENQSQSQSQIFSLTIDPVIKSHLSETARWGKFLAILGFIVCGLIVLVGLFFGTIFGSLVSRSEVSYEGNISSGSLGAMAAVIYIVIAVIYFFPCLFLYRFSTKMKTALNGNEQTDLTLSFQNLKSLFRYVGVITVILLAIYLIVIVFALLAGTFISR